MNKEEKKQRKKAYDDSIKVLEDYTVNPELKEFHILHMYPEKEGAYPHGFYDARFFRVMAYNTKTQEVRDFGIHDDIRNDDPHKVLPIIMIRIYVDGSTLIRFAETMTTPYIHTSSLWLDT